MSEERIILAHSGHGEIAPKVATNMKESVLVIDLSEKIDEFTPDPMVQEFIDYTLESAEQYKQIIESNIMAEALMFGGNQTPKKWRGGVNVPVGSDKQQGRNEPCACGSGKKFKKCCINKKPQS